MKDDPAMLFASLGDVDAEVAIEDVTYSLEELRNDYTERFFTREGLELLKAAGLENEDSTEG